MNLSNAVDFYSCLIAIMDHYGYDHQVYAILPEEVDELREAFDAYFDKPSPEHWHHVIEECADVHIMLELFQHDVDIGALRNAPMSTSCWNSSKC